MTADTETVQHPSVEGFFAWCSERNSIYHKKEILNESPPWTDDDILQTYHWCNTHRELDRGSRVFLEDVVPDTEGDIDLLITDFVYRLLNKPESYWEVHEFLSGVDSDMGAVVETLEGLESPFSATFRRNGPRDGYTGKVEQLFYGIVRDQLIPDAEYYTEEVLYTDSLEYAHSTLTEITGVGDFLADVILFDLNHAHINLPENSFVNVGPGASGGLEYMFGENRNGDDRDYLEWIRLIQNRYLPEDVWFPDHKSELTLQDIQHSLCEYESYMRIRNGGSHKYYKGYSDGIDKLSEF